MPEPRAAAGLPAWVFLNTTARIGRRANATTARTLTSAGAAIEVSFEVAHPPGHSHCFVHSPDLMASDHHPRCVSVTGADGAFVLLRATFSARGGQRMFTDAFVYRAGPGVPSLHLLPCPCPVALYSTAVGVLSCDGERHCLVVVPERRFGPTAAGYDLHLFSTRTGSWSTRATCDIGWLPWHEHTKVFSVGGGSLAWVDLRNGVLLCNVLVGGEVHERPEMRRIHLPPLLPSNKHYFGVCSDGAEPPLDQIRDVTCRGGRLRFVEMEFPEVPDDSDDDDLTPLRWRWTATVFTTPISSQNWELCHTVDSADLSPAEACVPDLVPEMWDAKEKKLTLDRMIALAPTLDMYDDDDALYTTAKLDGRDPNGWVLAVDAQNKKLEKVAPFSAEASFSRTYMQCAFSKYLNSAPSLRPPLKKTLTGGSHLP